MDVRRRREPIGTGRANEMPSRERKVTCPRVNRHEFANPSSYARRIK